MPSQGQSYPGLEKDLEKQLLPPPRPIEGRGGKQQLQLLLMLEKFPVCEADRGFATSLPLLVSQSPGAECKEHYPLSASPAFPPCHSAEPQGW